MIKYKNLIILHSCILQGSLFKLRAWLTNTYYDNLTLVSVSNEYKELTDESNHASKQATILAAYSIF